MKERKSFPDTSVKQALQECDLHRGDEIIISLIQTSLLPRCMYDIYKSAAIHAIMQQRKFINEKDLQYARIVTIFRSKHAIRNEGILLEHRHFIHQMSSVRDLLQKYINKCMIGKNIPKMSEQTSHLYQEIVEECVRHFLRLLKDRSRTSQITYHHFNSCMSLVMGDWSMMMCQETFATM